MTRRLRLTALVAVVVGWGLRLSNLSGPELWFDEAASHFIASRSPQGILTYVASAPFEHPPLYYLLLHGSMQFLGDSEWGLRFPSVLLGMALLLLLWRAGTSSGGPALAVLVLAFASVSPFLITYSQEARMYALLQCLGLLSTMLLHRSLVQPGWAGWALYGLTMIAGVTTHYFYAFLLPAHALMAVILEPGTSRRILRVIVLACLVGTAVGAAALLLLHGPRSAAAQMLQEGLWGKSPTAIGRLVVDWAYGGAIITGRPVWAGPLAIASLVLPAAGLVTAVLPRRTRVALGVWVVVPVVLAIAVPYGGLVLRHFSYVVPALCLLAAAGMLALARRSRWLAALAILVVAVTALPGLVWLQEADKGEYRAALEHITERHRDGDLILLANPHQWVPFTYYNRAHLDSRPVGDGRAVPADEVAAAERLWLLEWETWAVDDMGAVRDTLLQSAAFAYSLDLSTNVRLSLLYPLPPGPPTFVPGLAWSDGHALSNARVWGQSRRPGDGVVVSLCWSDGVPVDGEVSVALRLAGADGRSWAESVLDPGANHASAGHAVCSAHAISLPGGTPPGRYHLELGLIGLTSGAQMAATAADGRALGPWAPMAEVDIDRTPYPAPPVIPGTGGDLDDSLRLVGAETDVARLSAGSAWEGIIQAQTLAQRPPGDLVVQVVGPGGARALGRWPLSTGALSEREWQSGEVWRCPLEVRLPADLPAGQYRLQARSAAAAEAQASLLVRLLDRTDGWITVDTFSVTERTPHQVETQPGTGIDVVFGGAIRLYGYDQRLEAGSLYVTLFWEALAPTSEAHKAFVHLARRGVGEPVAQDDRPPALTPTNEWLEGETYSSEHVLSLPDGREDLVLRVGLYSERTMVRLPAAGTGAQADHLELAVQPDGLIRSP